MKASVNNIIHFSNVDGPGNRMSIFFQSCPFKCLYCHNPETINMCINCGKCVESCPTNALKMIDNKVVWNEKLCCGCDKCIHICPNMASAKIHLMSVLDIINELKEEIDFVEGITVSGGECMNHTDFLLELFKEVKKLNKTCLIDSNGYYDFKNYTELLDYCDGVMLDIKAFDDDFHKFITTKSNETVIENLKYLKSINKLEEVRTVLLPGFDEENINTVKNVSMIIQDNCRYKLLRYRPFGVREEGLNKIGNIIYPKDEAMELVELAHKLGATKTVCV